MNARLIDSRALARLRLDADALANAARAALAPGERRAAFTHAGRQFGVSATTLNAAAFVVVDLASGQRLLALVGDVPPWPAPRGKSAQVFTRPPRVVHGW